MITKDTINEDLIFYKKLRRNLSKQLWHLPEGSAWFRQQHGKARPYVTEKGVEKYVSKQNYDYFSKILFRTEIEHALPLIEENIRILEQVESKIHPPELVIPPRYDCDEYPSLDAMIQQMHSIPSGKPGYGNIHTTSTGVQVKSKSELLLFEDLKAHGLTFVYERPLGINGQIWYPDFSILREEDRRFIPLEQFGMMSDPVYRQQAEEKIAIYAANGYLPYKNIIYTYDNLDGSIDLGEVNRTLAMMRLI